MVADLAVGVSIMTEVVLVAIRPADRVPIWAVPTKASLEAAAKNFMVGIRKVGSFE